MVWSHRLPLARFIDRMVSAVRRVKTTQPDVTESKSDHIELPKATETQTNTLPKVAIFTVEGVPAEQEWASIDLESEVDSSRRGEAHPETDNHLARDPLPRLEHYRTSQKAIRRPSIGELHGDLDEKGSESKDKNDQPTSGGGHGSRFGWIQGVLIPCLLNIWGVMLFLRLSWIVALAGVLETLLIIGLSYVVCVITTLSLSAICTNGQVKGGGIYYLISRSLGPEFGGAVGIVLAFANSVAASMNTIGFCNSLNQLLASYGVKIVDGGLNDVRIVGTITIIVMVVICAVGMDWEIKVQNFLVLAIVMAIGSFVVGVFVGPRMDEQLGKGFSGLSGDRLLANLGPDYRYSEGIKQNFFSVFGVFFPSVTGVQAGANICGELKDPATAIPKGTLLALLISGVSYVLLVLLAGSATHRDATGSLEDLLNGTFVDSCRRALATEEPCQYGLHNDYTLMQLTAISGLLIYAGCFAATLSTALTNLLSVPRIIQALGTDRLYPGLMFFARGYGKRQQPYRAYALVLAVSVLFVLLAKLNMIAPLITTFYLASYALINFCTFHAATVKPIGWRPTFRFYHPWVSLFGTALCVLIAFLIDIISTGFTLVLIAVLHLTVFYRKPNVNWGSTTQAQTYKSALSAALRLQCVGDHVKNYHPSVLVLAGKASARPPLIDLAHQITKGQAVMIVGDVVPDRLSHRRRELRAADSRRFLRERHIRAFYQQIDGIGFGEGVRALIQTAGVGKLAPNIALIGYKTDWMRCSLVDLQTYYNVLNDVFDNRMALAILRLPNGLDITHLGNEPGSDETRTISANESFASLQHCTGNGSPRKAMKWQRKISTINSEGSPSRTSRESVPSVSRSGSWMPRELLDRLQVFRRKQPSGTIDVWWLYDDGGLTMLIPHILSLRSKWALCKVRVFALTNRQSALEEERKNMANLLAKLRIEYASLTMLPNVAKLPRPETVAMHRQLLKHFEPFPAQLSPPELSATDRAELDGKTDRQLRLREMILEHSPEAALIVMSMTMPRLGTVSAPLYMSWLEMLTKDMPPMLLVRGNQTSVLTFYS
ncbi:AGAP003275-PA-like protein [Anopheles sinensis]|uniref:AGAP003275-PA-like protein n=1 Tax=Anopheles sinensis TaxID=74873 RepID=A0A084W3D0_ANOSI|nr:AGAP003275-PA-like protein [Anopheles sinensis]